LGLDWRRDEVLSPSGLATLGVYRDLVSPEIGLLAVSTEAYAGLRSTRPDGGLRVFLNLPALRVSAGADYNIPDDRAAFALALTMPVRRGGIFRGGTLLRAEWTAAPLSAVRASVIVPVRQPSAGRTRPLRDHVTVSEREVNGPTPAPPVPELRAALGNVRTGARRLTHLVMPYLDGPGADPRAALRPLLEELRHTPELPGADGPGLGVEAVVRAYHAELTRAFSTAVSGRELLPGATTPEGELAAELARTSLRQHVLYPYDRLLGQKKDRETLPWLATHARGTFARLMLSRLSLPEVRQDALLRVFEHLLETIRDIEHETLERWGDSRLAWLPLQLGLRPEDHDTQVELDAVLEGVVGARFTDGNRVWYVVNQQFQTEVIRSITDARDYHVLWVHDFSGHNEPGIPDALSQRDVVEAYFRALIDRVREYDQRQRLPVYMIFLDQHYYEANRGRMWLDLLERPLGPIPRLPRGFERFTALLAQRQQELRSAIEGSRLLQAEARQYGTEWLGNQIKVHVSITNPADPSFWSRQIIPVLGIPDNLMRDHRKIVFYDISEDDPYRGLAMYTGMGIGEHYLGEEWEDRAIMVQGPAVLALKAQARMLLEGQGLAGNRMPYVLRPRGQAPEYQLMVDAEVARRRSVGSRMQRAVELHNGTGFRDKQVTVAKAVLYGLMPPGSVIKVPDALWGSALYASLLTGSALRGCRVLFVAPSLGSAPASSWASMGIAHELFARLIVLQQELGPELEAAGGMLKTGIYSPGVGVGNVIGRFATAWDNARRTPFLRRLFPVSARVDSLLKTLDEPSPVLQPAPDAVLPPPPTPKLHLKANFFASREGWDSLLARPEIEPMLLGYIGQLLRTAPRDFDVRAAGDSLAVISDQLEAGYRQSLEPERRDRMLYFLMVGSGNQDYRSMLMDGEAMMLLSGWSGIVGIIDISLIISLSVWVDDLEMLDALLPPPTPFKRSVARWLRFAF
jgi:hypothetical protein